MSARTFNFSSPGIYTKEIDKTQTSNTPDPLGPGVIGRFSMGPSGRPVLITSLEDLRLTFGEPDAGTGTEDSWRDGNYDAPTYAAYAAKAYLRSTGPINVIRLLGEEHPDAASSTSDSAEAGWWVKKSTGGAHVTASSTNSGGAYGLFVADSGSSAAQTNLTGTLAAVFYVTTGSFKLSGKDFGGNDETGNCVLLVNESKNQFKMVHPKKGDSTTTVTSTFNFDPESDSFIRNVFNTDPRSTNSTITNASDLNYYWLGESFEEDVKATCTANKQIAFVAALGNETGSLYHSDFRMANEPASTPWIVSQFTGVPADLGGTLDFTTGFKKLFKLVSLDAGEWPSKNLKVSITDVRAADGLNLYGTFKVLVRAYGDQDDRPEIVESFSNLNLNPASDNYIAKRLGDMYSEWDESTRSYRTIGSNPNVSRHFRVVMADDLDGRGMIPFGFYGPPRFKSFSASGTATTSTLSPVPSTSNAIWILDPADNFDKGTGAAAGVLGHADETVTTDIKWQFPTIRLTVSSSYLNPAKPENTYWGLTNLRSSSKKKIDQSYKDLMWPSSNGVSFGNLKSEPDTNLQEYSLYFTLDNVSASTESTTVQHYIYDESALLNSASVSHLSGAEGAIEAGIDKFTVPVIGGFDGLDIQEKDSFGTHILNGTLAGQDNSSFYTVGRAIDAFAESEEIDIDILTAPGFTHPQVTDQIMDAAEARADCLAIIDLEGGYIPSTDSTNAEIDRIGSVDSTVELKKDRDLNTSYSCAYYPWVKVRDRITSEVVWVPPSVIALGTIGRSETVSELWFAPAGFNRGGLSDGASGLDVIGVRERVRAKDRDKLYENNINPIATFPAEGIVVFGQKTLQATPSALDRINVRRLMIHLKREISKIAKGVLFDQNVQATWQRFLRQAEPFLTNVKVRFGVSDFLILLDENTTTPELVDRNTMYAKIFIKPARSIEFIALDFVITNTGADFLA